MILINCKRLIESLRPFGAYSWYIVTEKECRGFLRDGYIFTYKTYVGSIDYKDACVRFNSNNKNSTWSYEAETGYDISKPLHIFRLKK